MTAEDVDKVIALWKNTPGIGMRDDDDSPEALVRFLERNSRSCFIAESNGAIIGAVLGGQDGRRGRLYHLAVAEEARHQGIARKLVNAVLDAFRDAGIRKVSVNVFADNETGNAFWEHLGFTGRDDLIYRDFVL